MTIQDAKEIAKSGLETAQFMIAAANRKYDAGEINFSSFEAKKQEANDYYMHRLNRIDEILSA